MCPTIIKHCVVGRPVVEGNYVDRPHAWAQKGGAACTWMSSQRLRKSRFERLCMDRIGRRKVVPHRRGCSSRGAREEVATSLQGPTTGWLLAMCRHDNALGGEQPMARPRRRWRTGAGRDGHAWALEAQEPREVGRQGPRHVNTWRARSGKISSGPNH
jgi:hypothetical protein